MPLVSEVQKYASTTVYYQTYVSLMNQDVKTIKLSTAVAELGANVEPEADVITESAYIFEPSAHAVIDHLERAMLQIALSQVVLESKLAQYASRFRAMSMAKDKANELSNDMRMLYNRTKRRIQDERLKEMTNGLRMGGKQ